MATYVSLVVGNGKKRKQNYFNIRRKKNAKQDKQIKCKD